MTKPKLILINHYASVPRYPGPTRNFDFASVLVKQGWDVSLLCCLFNHYLRRYIPQPPDMEGRVKLKWVWSSPYRGNSIQRELNIIIFSILSFWKGLFTPGNVIITVTPPLESAWLGWLLSRVKRIPFILDVEDLWPDSLISMGFRNRLVISGLRWLEKFLYQHAEHILVVAVEMKSYLLRCGVPESKISLIPLGANQAKPVKDRFEIRRNYGWADDEIIAAYMGAHGPANALDTLLLAAEQLSPETKVRIVLFGDGSDKPRLERLLATMGNIKCNLEAPVPPEQVPGILQAVDIGIASLKQTETFKTVRPNKLYEYMAAGLPIVCCIDGEAKRFVETARAGICVPSEDYAGLAKTLTKLAADPELRQKLAENGLTFFKKEGDREKLALKMDEVLRKVSLTKK